MSVTKVSGMMQTSTKGGDISSASPTVIDTDGDYFDVTGTTNFAAFTVTSGRRFTIQFDGVLTMTHHATTLDLPGGANITTAAGDVAEFFATGTNTVQCVNYTRASGVAIKIADNSIDSDHLKDALVGDFTDATVTASDYFLHGDATDSGNTKKDTVQGILDLTGGSLSSTAVLAILSGTQANVTGDGTNYTATGAIWTEIADKGSDFVNGTFTAPSTGTYLIGYAAGISGQNTDTLNYHKMVTSNRTHQYEHGDYSGIDSTNAQMVFGNMMLADFDSGDTCTFQIDHNNGAKGVDLTTGSGNDTKLFFLLVA